MAVITQKLEKSIISSGLIGVSLMLIKIAGNEKPFYTVDECDSVAAGLRTLGAGFNSTPVVVADNLQWRKLGVQFTTVSTTAQTISYSTQIDLSQNFFNSADDQRLLIPLKAVTDFTTYTGAQRLVNIQFVDTAATPITFKNATGANIVQVPEFDYTIGNVVDSVIGLVDEIISIPLAKLVSSTTKIFTLTITFNLPSAASFYLHGVKIYKNQWDSILLGYPDIVIVAPKNIQPNADDATKKVKGVLGEIVAIKAGARNFSVEFETVAMNIRQSQLLSGATVVLGGKIPLATQLVTIPTSPYQISSLTGLQNTDTEQDIFVSIQQLDGTFREANLVEGGSYLASGVVRYIREGTKKLQFSASDSGKKAKVVIFATDSSATEESYSGIKTIITGDVTILTTDSSDPDQAKLKVSETYTNVAIDASPIYTDVGSEELPRLKVSLSSLTQDLSKTLKTRTYKV